MNQVLHGICTPLRAWVRALQSQRTSVSTVEKLGRAVVMLPAFALLLILLRLALALRLATNVEITTRAGDKFVCRPPDLIQLYLWLFDIWEPDVTEFIQRRLNQGDCFVDVGANIGYYSAVSSRGVGTGGRVVAIEASLAVFSDLEHTLTINAHCRNVRAVNKAAAAGPGVLDIYSGPAHNTGLTTTVATRRFPVQTAVEAARLDDLLVSEELKRARIVKIDVEGGEDAVLAGMTRIANEQRQDVEIVVELSPAWWSDQSQRPIDVLRPFFEAGFHAYEMRNNYWPWRYLWPGCVSRPQRMRRELTRRVKRLDVVLSRQDTEQL